MPIYKQTNGTEAVLSTEDIEYNDNENRLAKESVVVHFGYGDICISVAKSRSDYPDELVFTHSLEHHEIGETEGEDYDKRVIFPPVRLIFDKPESIDVVISKLEELKSEFPFAGVTR